MKERKEERVSGIRNIIITDGDKEYSVTLMNISRTGISVKSQYSLPAYKLISIKADINGIMYELEGSVRWVNEDPDKSGLREIGIRLKDPPSEYLDFFDS